MIIDAFTYYNEEMMLDFHIKHVYDHVDKIIVIEGDRTFDGRPYKHKLRPGVADPKIEYHIVPLLENPSSRWENEALQRTFAGDIAKQYDGRLFYECVDEIINTDFYDMADQLDEPLTLALDNYYYYFNGKDTGNSTHPMPITLKTSDITDLHQQWERRHGFTTLEHSGWHFSYLGGTDLIKQKLEAFSHSEFDTSEVKDNLKINIEAGRDIFGRPDHQFEYVEIDDTFPKELYENHKQYEEYIHD